MCWEVHHIWVLSLTCSVDHALGCCCRSRKDVGCAASSGGSTSGGCAHRVDWQAARWRLFDWNHDTPVRDETKSPQTNLHTHNILYHVLLSDISALHVGQWEHLRGWPYSRLQSPLRRHVDVRACLLLVYATITIPRATKSVTELLNLLESVLEFQS